jgi:hypothetical protein
MMTQTTQELIARLSQLELHELETVIEFAQEILENMRPDEYDERPLKPDIAESLRKSQRGEVKYYLMAEVRKNLGFDE